MTENDRIILSRMAEDIGYIKGAITPLKDIPERVTRIEERQDGLDKQVTFIATRREKTTAKLLVLCATCATVITAVVAAITLGVNNL